MPANLWSSSVATRPILALLLCALCSLCSLRSLVVPAEVCAQAPHIGREFIAPSHWAYPALYRFETLGLISLPSEKPFSRDDIVGYIESITSAIASRGVVLSSRDRFELSRLDKEFLAAAARVDPKVRYDSPVFVVRDGPVFFEGDADLSLIPQQTLLDKRWEFLGVANPSMKIHVRDWLTYEFAYRLTLGPERGDRVRDHKPSPRERSFKGLTSLMERSYLIYRWKKLKLFWGRDFVDWGPAENGNLHLAQTAGSLDQLGMRLAFRNFRLSLVHANLSARGNRQLAAHRLEATFGHVVAGIVETAVYVNDGIDPTYALPLSSFYANQFNEREDSDNVMWSFDIKYTPIEGALVYGGFLIDDFQFERADSFPDKVAFDVGARVAVGGFVPATVAIRYRYVDIHTFTHEDSITAYVTGSGLPSEGEAFLGASQGPDTDLLTMSAAVYPVPEVTTTFGFSLMRRGEGSDFREFVPGDDPTPPFPLGVVEKTFSYGVVLLWELAGNSSAGVEFRRVFVDNVGHQRGVDEWRNAARAHLTWDF